MTRRTFATRLTGTAGALFAGIGTAHAEGTKYRVYLGAYTSGVFDSKGIYMASFDAATGELGKPSLAVEAASPSFLEIHPSGKYVYAVGEGDGSVRAFSMQADGQLKLINRVSSKGSGPCHVNIDKTGKMGVVACYDSGSVASFQIKDDGSLSEATSFIQHDTEKGRKPHAHSANFSPDNRFVLICDLGLDKVFSYKLDVSAGTITPSSFAMTPPKAGPRHLVFAKDGKHVFVNDETSLSETTFAYEAEGGTLKTLDTVSVLPKDVPFSSKYSTAETRLHPNGKWLYTSVRTHDTIARFDCDETTGKLIHVSNTPSGGKTPRNFNIDPSGKWLVAAHQDDGKVVVFTIDQTTGDIKLTDQAQHVSGCVCVRFLPLT